MWMNLLRIVSGSCLLLAATALAYDGGVVEGGAIVRGTVRFEGTPPPASPRAVFKHHEVCGKSVENESLVLGSGQTVRYAVVSLEGITRGRAVEREVINVLDNQRCRFVPHVLAASVGQWLLLTNADPILHNADAIDLETGRTLFNVALPTGKQIRRPLVAPGRIRVLCEVRHTWMEAFVVVAEHPYVTVTDAEGAYELRDIPEGNYRLRVWHERLGTVERPVRFENGGAHVEDVAYAESD